MKFEKSAKKIVAALVFVSISAISPSTLTSASSVVGTVSSLTGARHIAIDPTGTFSYVLEDGGAVDKINLSTDLVVSRISLSTSGYDIAIDPAGTFAYVLVWNEIKKIDLSSFTVADTIAFNSDGPYSKRIAINPAGTFAYITCDRKVAKVDLRTNSVSLLSLSLRAPYDVAIDSVGAFAYVTDLNLKTLSKIDLANDSVVATFAVGMDPNGVAVDPAGLFVYVSNYSDSLAQGVLSKIDARTGSIISSVPVGTYLGNVTINSAGTLALVADNTGGTVTRINLTNFQKVKTMNVGKSPWGIAINPSGTFAYIANIDSGTVSKIAVSPTESQSITFVTVGKSVIPAPLDQLFGAKSVVVSGDATSGLPVTFSSSTSSVCSVFGATVTFVTSGDCTVNADQAGNSDWDAATQVSRTFSILPSPPAGEVGTSINDGVAYTNSKSVILNLVWPEFATAVRVSNDGGFAASKTSIFKLEPSIKWVLDDSVKGIYTKVVYVRFSGIGDTAKSYTDDIILDTTAPVVESSSADAVSGSINLTLKATDDITGVDKIQVKNGITTVTKDYGSKVSVTEKELGLTVSASSVRKTDTSTIEIRVSDKAGNWSAYQTLSVYRAGSDAVTTPTVTTPTVTTPTVTTPTVVIPKVTATKSASAKSIATYAKLTVLSTSKVSLKVVASYAKYCKVSGTTLRGLKAGSCKVTVTVTLKSGRRSSKTVTLKVTK